MFTRFPFLVLCHARCLHDKLDDWGSFWVSYRKGLGKRHAPQHPVTEYICCTLYTIRTQHARWTPNAKNRRWTPTVHSP